MEHISRTKKILLFKKLYGPFLWMGFNCPKATELQWGGSLIFATKFPEIPRTHLIDPRSMKGWDDVRSTVPLDWESSALTTRRRRHLIVRAKSFLVYCKKMLHQSVIFFLFYCFYYWLGKNLRVLSSSKIYEKYGTSSFRTFFNYIQEQ